MRGQTDPARIAVDGGVLCALSHPGGCRLLLPASDAASVGNGFVSRCTVAALWRKCERRRSRTLRASLFTSRELVSRTSSRTAGSPWETSGRRRCHLPSVWRLERRSRGHYPPTRLEDSRDPIRACPPGHSSRRGRSRDLKWHRQRLGRPDPAALTPSCASTRVSISDN